MRATAERQSRQKKSMAHSHEMQATLRKPLVSFPHLRLGHITGVYTAPDLAGLPPKCSASMKLRICWER